MSYCSNQRKIRSLNQIKPNKDSISISEPEVRDDVLKAGKE